LNDVALLKDVFLWAYGRSAEQYAAVRQSLGEPDPFRFKHRAALRQVVADLVRARQPRKDAPAFLAQWIEEISLRMSARASGRWPNLIFWASMRAISRGTS